LSTFLAEFGCTATVGLLGLLFWVRREYGLETAAMIRIIKEQNSYTDALCDAQNVNRERIAALEDGVAERDKTIQGLQSEREESAKRILQLEELYRVKCKETGAMNWEINAGRDVRSAALELSQLLSEFVQGMDGSRPKNLFAPVTLQPKRPEEQPQKPTCDN
jgi:hypothetical protein